MVFATRLGSFIYFWQFSNEYPIFLSTLFLSPISPLLGPISPVLQEEGRESKTTLRRIQRGNLLEENANCSDDI